MIIQRPFDMMIKIPNTNTVDTLHCVYECMINSEAVFVGWCKLVNVFHLAEARENSEFHRMFHPGCAVDIRIHMMTDNAQEAERAAFARLKEYPVMPRCNLHGFNLKNSARPFICKETGRTFNTQLEASTVMNLNQGNLSRHLKGQLKSCGGYTFEYTS